MADTWELVLHHTYRGTPGVILDESPRRECHGRAVNLDHGAFNESGAQPGSGAVFFRPNSHIQVPANPDVWNRNTPIRMEFVCRVDDPTGGMLFGSRNFLELAIRDGALVAHVLGFGSVVEHSTAGSGVEVPTGSWVTVNFDYDGLTEMEFRVDGRPVHITERFAPVTEIDHEFCIGSDHTGAQVFGGGIDDVKIWRLDRHHVGHNFTDRPSDPGVVDCWLEWGKRARKLLQDDADCAERLPVLIKDAIRSLAQAGLLGGDEARSRWLSSYEKYQKHWSEGDMNSVAGVIDDLDQLLKKLGLDAAQIPEVKALFDDLCFKKFVKILGPPDCDTEFIDLFKVTGDLLGRS